MKRTRIAALILSLALAVGCIAVFAACGGGGGGNDESVKSVMINEVEESYEMKMGESLTVTARTNLNAENKKVNWSVSDSTLLTLAPEDDAPTNTCVVTAASDKSGTVTLTATSDGNPEVKDECMITIKAPGVLVATATQTGIDMDEAAAVDPSVSCTIKFYDDNTCEIEGFITGMVSAIGVMRFTAEYTVTDGILTISNSVLPSAFGDIAMSFQVRQFGTTEITGWRTDNPEYGNHTFEMTEEESEKLGLEQQEKVAVTNIGLKSDYVDGYTMESGETFDVNTAIYFEPENASIKESTVSFYSEIPGDIGAIMAAAQAENATISGSVITALKPGAIQVKIASVDNPEKYAILNITITEKEKPTGIGLTENYFTAEKKFVTTSTATGAPTQTEIIIFGTDGKVEFRKPSDNTLTDIGYYSLDAAEASATKLTVYSIIANLAETYTLVKGEDGLYSFDKGAAQGLPDIIVSEEMVLYTTWTDAVGSKYFDTNKTFAIDLSWMLPDLVAEYTFKTDGSIVDQENKAAGYYGLKEENGKTYMYFVSKGENIYSNEVVKMEYSTNESGKIVIPDFNGLGEAVEK